MFLVKCQRFLSVSTQQAMKAKVIVLNKKFEGFPDKSNFKLIDESVPNLKDGEFLAEAEYLSVDPYMRVYTTSADVGKPIIGEQVAKIIQSKNPKYPVGEHVVGEFGWRTLTVASETQGNFFKRPPRVLTDYGNLPKSLALGALGMTGNAAYFGFTTICKPQKGNTVVVSGAAGAVGTHVGQIAKILGCRVVGITSSEAKGKRLVEEANFDAWVNYKSPDFEEKLAEAVPNAIDCYFDNVGGEISSSVLNKMKKFGNVAVCGAISTYNDPSAKAREVQTPVKIGNVVMEGFAVHRWRQQWDEGIKQNMQWIRQGQLKYFEHVTTGFENMDEAFMGMLRGENFGKAIVKCI